MASDAVVSAEMFQTAAATLGEALTACTAHFGVRVAPMSDLTALGYAPDERRLFEFCDPPQVPGFAVDIPILRGAGEICPRRDPAFPLRPGDVIGMGPLLC